MKAQKTLLSFTLTATFIGCQVQSPATTGPLPPPPPAAPGAGEAAVSGSPDCPNPQDHCLQDGVVFIATKPLSSGWIHADLATPKTAAGPGEEAAFFNLHSNKEQITKYHYVTRPALVGDLVVGKTVFWFHQRDGQIYRAPATRKEAMKRTWSMAKIASVASASSNGFVIITGGYQVAVNNLRVSDTVPDPGVTVDLASGEDVHYLTPNHYLVSRNPLKAKWIIVDVAAPITLPSAATDGDGQFLSLNDGTVAWTKNNWHTRPATQEDLKVGTQIFMLRDRDGQVYRAPRDRSESLGKRWWTARVSDTSQLYKGQVMVETGDLVKLEAIRVAD